MAARVKTQDGVAITAVTGIGQMSLALDDILAF